MSQHRNVRNVSPPSWWVRFAVLALACLQVIAPTWHVCSMGATGAGPKKVAIQCACSIPEASSGNDSYPLTNQPMADDMCLARLLQHVLGNSQFRLILDFKAVTVSTLAEPSADTPLIRALPVRSARGPPSHLL